MKWKFYEQSTGIEPMSLAWEANVLPSRRACRLPDFLIYCELRNSENAVIARVESPWQSRDLLYFSGLLCFARNDKSAFRNSRYITL